LAEYYIRIRTTVRGPFTPEKLKELGRRGQFSRHYHVSVDGQNWEPAANHPELLPDAKAVKIRKRPIEELVTDSGSYELAEEPETQQQAHEDDEHRTADDVDAVEAVWYYACAGEQHGPVSLAELKGLVLAGDLQYNDCVWTEGMADWVEAFSVPGLFSEDEFANLADASKGQATDDFPDDRSSPAGKPTPLALASLIAGLLGATVCFCVASVAAVVLGHLAMRQIAASGYTLGGRGLAMAGLILGYVMIAVTAMVSVGWIGITLLGGFP